jgi:hypothetical protein
VLPIEPWPGIGIVIVAVIVVALVIVAVHLNGNTPVVVIDPRPTANGENRPRSGVRDRLLDRPAYV